MWPLRSVGGSGDSCGPERVPGWPPPSALPAGLTSTSWRLKTVTSEVTRDSAAWPCGLGSAGRCFWDQLGSHDSEASCRAGEEGRFDGSAGTAPAFSRSPQAVHTVAQAGSSGAQRRSCHFCYIDSFGRGKWQEPSRGECVEATHQCEEPQSRPAGNCGHVCKPSSRHRSDPPPNAPSLRRLEGAGSATRQLPHGECPPRSVC